MATRSRPTGAKRAKGAKQPAKATRARGSADTVLAKLRAACLALPGATDVPAWGTSTFRCGKIFAMYSPASDTIHSGGRPGVWLKAAPGVAALMIRDRPDRFYFPPYVGPSGWVGVWLDRRPSWKEVAELVRDSWALVAPKRLLATSRAAVSDSARGARRSRSGG